MVAEHADVGEVVPPVPPAVTHAAERAVVKLGLFLKNTIRLISPPFASNTYVGTVVPTVGAEASYNLRKLAAAPLAELSNTNAEMYMVPDAMALSAVAFGARTILRDPVVGEDTSVLLVTLI